MELLSVMLLLKPKNGDGWKRLMGGWWGRAAHQALVDLLLKAPAPKLVEQDVPDIEIHPQTNGNKSGDNDRRPFTVSNLEINADGFFELRVTALTSDLCRRLEYLCMNDLAPGQFIEIDHIALRIVFIATRPTDHPMAMKSSYPLLYQANLERTAQEEWSIRMNFATPFVFSRKNSKPHLALPLPEIVFGGLSKTWNFMVARDVFPYDEVYNLAYTSLAISEFDLKSTLTQKKGGKLIGATGHVTYELLSRDPVAMHIFSTLAQYAFYAGVGKETAKGMGQVRLP